MYYGSPCIMVLEFGNFCLYCGQKICLFSWKNLHKIIVFTYDKYIVYTSIFIIEVTSLFVICQQLSHASFPQKLYVR
jgi:hypothetical protein